MPDLLSMYAGVHPDKDGVIEDGQAISYAEFERRANQLGHALQELGITAGSKLVWCAQNSTDVVIIVNAARKAGAVAVPLNYRLSSDEASYVIDNSDAVLVLFDVEQADQLAPCVAECPKVTRWMAFHGTPEQTPDWAEHLPTLAASQPETEVEPKGGDQAQGGSMIYTSGTTGKPKGALRKGAGANPEDTAQFLATVGYQPDDVYLTTGPLYHSGPLGFMGIVQALGGTIVVQRHFDAEDWLRLVQEHKVTTTFSAPTPIRRVVDLPKDVRDKYDTSSLARVIANAAPWPFELKRKYVDAFGDTSLFEVYGSTELSVNTMLTPPDQMRKPGSCGKPLPGVEIALFDEEGNQVTTPLEPGELFVRSKAVFDTYYKAEEKFESSKREGGWLTVGDIAYVDEEGYFYICDRKNDMIISGGVNIYPAEIEAVLVAHPAIADAAVFGIPSEEWGEGVHATITLYGGASASDDEIMAFCRDHLAGYKVPRSFDRMEEIPRSASGKILKKELRAPFWADRASQV